MKKIKKFKVIKCTKCGRISVSSATKLFKCNYCNKSTTIFKKSELGLGVNLIKSFDDPKSASDYCRVAKDLDENQGKLADLDYY